jgi:hypothetical protein
MTGDIEVQNSATPMFYHEQALQKSERHGRHREEVQRDNRLAMILKEGQPTLLRVAAAVEATKIASHRSFRNVESQLS